MRLFLSYQCDLSLYFQLKTQQHQKWRFQHLETYHLVQALVIHHRPVRAIAALAIQVTAKQVRILEQFCKQEKKYKRKTNTRTQTNQYENPSQTQNKEKKGNIFQIFFFSKTVCWVTIFPLTK